MKNLTNDDPVTIHPMLLSQIDNKEQALVDFKNQISQFKPKQSILELKIAKTLDQDRIERFKDTLELQKGKTEEKRDRDQYKKELKVVMEKA